MYRVQQSPQVSRLGWVHRFEFFGVTLTALAKLLCRRKMTTFVDGFLQHCLGRWALLGKFTSLAGNARVASLQLYRFGCSLSNQRTARQCQLL